MYKNETIAEAEPETKSVSILVLMDLCIKTLFRLFLYTEQKSFNPCFNGSMYKNKILYQLN